VNNTFKSLGNKEHISISIEENENKFFKFKLRIEEYLLMTSLCLLKIKLRVLLTWLKILYK